MTQPIHQALERNRYHQCKAQGCTEQRYALGGYCLYHFKKANLYGDPKGQSLRKSEYRREFEDVTDLITSNIQHTATVTALEFIQSWLDKAASGQACILGRHLSRLSNGGVTALQILIEASAVFLYSQRKPSSLPDDDRLSYQIGIVILRLATAPAYINRSGQTAHRRPSGTDRKALGKHLRNNLGLFFFNVTAAINRKEQEELDMREKLWTPLDSTIRTDY